MPATPNTVRRSAAPRPLCRQRHAAGEIAFTFEIRALGPPPGLKGRGIPSARRPATMAYAGDHLQ